MLFIPKMIYQTQPLTIFIHIRRLIALLTFPFIMGCGGPDLSAFDLAKGKQVYNNTCIACHLKGMSSVAPKVGNESDWTARIAQGMDTLLSHSFNGFNEMPPKGGNADLSDEEVKNAVAFMVSKSY